MESVCVTSDQCIICTQPVSLLSEELVALNSINSHANQSSQGPTADDVIPILFQQPIGPSDQKIIVDNKSNQYCPSCFQRNEEILGVLRQLKALNACLETLQNAVENDLRHSFSRISKEPIVVPASSLLDLDSKNYIRLGILRKLNLIEIQEPSETGDNPEDDPTWFPVANEFEEVISTVGVDEKLASTPCQEPEKSPEVHTTDAIVILERLPKTLLENLPISVNSLATHGITVSSKRKRRRKFNGPRFVCKVPKCPRKLCFRTKEEFDMHMITHKGVTHPYPCDHCPMRFKKNHLRAVHTRNVHEGRKTYFCEQCGRGCISKTELTRHSGTHSTEATIQCPLCPQKFKTVYGLRSHKLWNHNPKREHSCDRCGKCFVTPQKLKNHVKAIHERDYKPHVCHLCGKGFPVQGYLYMHMRNSHKLNMDGQPYVASRNTLRGKCNRKKIEVGVEKQLVIQEEIHSEVTSVSDNKTVIIDNVKTDGPVDDFLARFVIPDGNGGFILEDHPGQETIIVVSTSI